MKSDNSIRRRLGYLLTPVRGGASRHIIVVLNILGWVLLNAASTSGNTSHLYPKWLTPCGSSSSALCGVYEVWENQTTRRGRKIGIHVRVLPARGNPRFPDPVFFLEGGPGESAIRATAEISAILAAVHQHRDLVFVDIRGTGRSGPLRCSSISPDAPPEILLGEFLPEDAVRKCRAEQTADVEQYTNTQAMDDLDEIREALGYKAINLYGISGGTRSAQVYLRRHPDSVRAIVIKGVVPMDEKNPAMFSRFLEAGMRRLIVDCMAEADCATAYPQLGKDWERSKRFFDAGPVAVQVRDPRSGKTESVKIGKGVYADGVRHILYSVEQSRKLPGLIHAAAQGDFGPFAERELVSVIAFARSFAYGTFLSTTCAEDVRFIREEDVRRETEGTFLGDYRVRRQQAACKIWGWGRNPGRDYTKPIRSTAPVLLISGDLDTATPPENGEKMAATLPNSRHVIFPNQSHDFANPPCEIRLMTEFIERGSARDLDVSCAAQTRRPPFIVK